MYQLLRTSEIILLEELFEKYIIYSTKHVVSFRSMTEHYQTEFYGQSQWIYNTFHY